MGNSSGTLGRHRGPTHESGQKMGKRVLAKKLETAAKTGVLNLSHGRLREIDPRVCELTKLRTLDLSGNKLAALPAEIAGLTALKKLSVSGNRLERLPNLAALQALQALHAASNKLLAIGGLPECLKTLDVSRNALDSIPPALLSVPALQDLNLANNALESLEGDYSGAVALTTLVADHNRLTAITESVAAAPALRTLSLCDNRIQHVPTALLEASTVTALDLAGNPISREALQATPGFGAFMERRKTLKDKAIAGGLHPRLDVCGL